MEKFSEVIQDINKLYKKEDEIYKKKRVIDRERQSREITFDQLKKAYAPLEKQQHKIDVKKALLLNNVRFLLIQEKIGIFISLWNSHIGETFNKDIFTKIQGEFFQKTGGIGLHLPTEGIISFRFQRIESWICAPNIIDKNNHILKANLNELINRYRYIEDVPQRLKDIQKCGDAIQVQIQKLKNLQENFRKLTLGTTADRFFDLG